MNTCKCGGDNFTTDPHGWMKCGDCGRVAHEASLDAVPGLDDLDDISIHDIPDPRIRSPRKYSGGSFAPDLANLQELQKMLDDKNRPSLAEVVESINKEAKL